MLLMVVVRCVSDLLVVMVWSLVEGEEGVFQTWCVLGVVAGGEVQGSEGKPPLLLLWWPQPVRLPWLASQYLPSVS